MESQRAEAADYDRTLWVVEEPPSAGEPRWYCSDSPGFDTPEEAVAWGLARAQTVIVRTLANGRYWAGERPTDSEGPADESLRAWPPPPNQRVEIDREYERKRLEDEADALARIAYEEARQRWLAEQHGDLESDPVNHACELLTSEEDETSIELEELSADRSLWGARRRESHAFGRPAEAISIVSGLSADDSWVSAVCEALARERTWRHTGRRSLLLVIRGTSERFHVTAASNRASISQHGLDWRRMREPGIAGSREPELPGSFLCDTRERANFFLSMARVPSDVWAVDVSGLWLEGDPGGSSGGDSGWMILPQPVGPERLRLVECDIPASHFPF